LDESPGTIKVVARVNRFNEPKIRFAGPLKHYMAAFLSTSVAASATQNPKRTKR